MYQIFNLTQSSIGKKNYVNADGEPTSLKLCKQFFVRHFGMRAEKVALHVADHPIPGGKRVVIQIKDCGGYNGIRYSVTEKKNHNCKGMMWGSTERAARDHLSLGSGGMWSTLKPRGTTRIVYVGVTEGHIDKTE